MYFCVTVCLSYSSQYVFLCRCLPVIEFAIRIFVSLFACHIIEFFLSLSNGATAQDGPRPPSRVSSILSSLGQLFCCRVHSMYFCVAVYLSCYRARSMYFCVAVCLSCYRVRSMYFCVAVCLSYYRVCSMYFCVAVYLSYYRVRSMYFFVAVYLSFYRVRSI
jgi:hypothetical protein